MMKTQFLVILLFVLSTTIFGQDLSQNIWGKIIDKDTKTPLIGVSVLVLNSSQTQAVMTDKKGNYLIPHVKQGRISLQFSMIGYKSSIVQNVELVSGKEFNLNIELEREILELKEVTIEVSKEKALNNLTSISARQIIIDEASKYAGSKNDIARIAANYPGVSNVNDGRNDIVIRGNSPNGLLWRLEGLDIPGPQHFSGIGSNGGFISIVNYNTLANSDFLTGAFPAEYGNATSGVFDLNLRTGNLRKKEYMFQLGALGTEFMLEGPFAKKSEASYLMNYRFSTTSILKALGLNLGYAGEASYQDAMFNVNLPTKKIGVFSLFGLGGCNVFNSLYKNADPNTFNEVVTENNNTNYRGGMGVVGLLHLFHLNSNMYVKTTVGVTGKYENVKIDSVSYITKDEIPFFVSNTFKKKISVQSFLRYIINPKINSKTGMSIERNYFNLSNDYKNDDGSLKFSELNGSGELDLYQVYTQWQYKKTNNLTFNVGVHSQYMFMNKTRSIEPRLGFNYQLNTSNMISFAYGHHEQMQTLHTYFISTNTPNGIFNTNKNLGFTKSHHFVLGDQIKLSPNSLFRVETYYQYLYHIPIEQSIYSSFSLANDGCTFITPSVDSLVSKGTAHNYGIELSLERLFDRGYYYLVSTSLFDSKYKGADGVLRNSAFNGHYIVNVLFGKEFNIKTRSKIIIDLKICYAGGRRYTPIDIEASKLLNKAIFIQSEAYSLHQKNYFRTDFKISYRLNCTKVMHEFFINIDNIFNTKNVFTQIYSNRTNNFEYIYQLGIFPTFQYKLYF